MTARTRFAFLCLLGPLALLAGCEKPPALEITHRLPAPLAVDWEHHLSTPPPPFIVHVEGAYTGNQQELAERLARSAAVAPPACGDTGLRASQAESRPARFGGEAWLTVTDEQGERVVRVGDPAQAFQTVSLPTLVRTIDLRVDYHIRTLEGTAAVVEVQRSYNSTSDPRVRGELALVRPGDPAAIPPASEVVPGLIEQAGAILHDMVLPVPLPVTIALRSVAGEPGNTALRYVRESRLPDALNAFARAAQQSPDNGAVWFNLAALREASGDVEPALDAYSRAAELLGEQDDPAASAVARLQRVTARWTAACRTDWRVAEE